MKAFSYIVAASVLALTACSSDKEAPTGQVVATVDGDEITLAELNAEMAGLPPEAAESPSVRQGVLESIVARRLLAQKAKADKLDQQPSAAILEKRARESVLAELVTENVRKSVPKPSDEEARRYIAENPYTFDQRRIFLVDQIIVESAKPEQVKALEPLNTMDEVANYLTQNKIRFNKTVGVIDAVMIGPKGAEQIAGLPANEVFITPDARTIRVNKIRETRVEPITGDTALRLAKDTIYANRTQEMVRNQVNQIVTAGLKKTSYNPQYKPKDDKEKAAAPAPSEAKK